MRKVPELRFDGFDGEWEEKKINDLAEFYSGGTPTSNNRSYYNGSIPFIRSGEIHSNTTELYISEEGLSDSSAKMVNKGDLVYALYGATSGEADIIRMSGAINQAILAIILEDEYNPIFILNYLNKSKNYILSKYLQGGQGNLSGQIVRNIDIALPKSSEQEKIGNLFKKIDDLIEIQEGKVSKIRDYKKSMLQKMFPKKDEHVPKFRFDGFDGEWKTVKFEEFLKEYNEKTKNEDELVMLSSTNSGMTYRERNVSVTTNVGYKIIYKNDLVLSPQNLWLGNINFNNLEDGIVSPSYLTFKIDDLDSNFIEPQLRTKRMLENYKNASSQGASVVRRNLEKNEFYGIKLLIPSLEEQQKIGQFFKNLDTQIENEEKLLDSYKMMKKSLLQKMFV